MICFLVALHVTRFSLQATHAAGEVSAAPSDAAECQRLQSAHSVIVGRSWGSLPKELITRWSDLECDRFFATEPEALVSGVSSAVGSLLPWGASRSPFAGDVTLRCQNLRARFPGVRVGGSWQALPFSVRNEWTNLRCDEILGEARQREWAEVAYVARYEDTLRAALRARADKLTRPANGTVVAIGVSTTTRTLAVSSLYDLSLFSIMLPSLVATAEAGYVYWLYVAYDLGDTFYDRPERRAEIAAWMRERVVGPLRKFRGIEADFVLLPFNNTIRKPGPVFNYMMAAAAEDGADYLYRINDDTEFTGREWTSQAVRALARVGNVGVVGPVCNEGNQNILTHDFVHRTHLYIFRTYYPPVFTDWWMDDWITRVYGPERTQRGPFLVVHHVDKHSTRYEVDLSHESQLARELDRGRTTIAAWRRAQGCIDAPAASGWS